MSSNPSKPSLKRPAESEINDEKDDSLDKAEERFRIKTLDEIRLEKRRRLEKDDASGEERNGSPTDNSGTASPVDSARRDRKPSSKQSSPAVQGTESEVIYQLSPEQTSLSSASSPSRTPKKLKQPSYDGGTSGVQVNRRRKTEEEEGEIVSDPSDSESRRSESRSRRYSSISNPEVEEKHEAAEQRDVTQEKKTDESSEEEDSDEEESEEDTETATATKRVQQGRKEMAEGKKESSVSESGSDSEESSSDDDDDDGDEKMEEAVSKSEHKESKVKQLREPKLKKSAPKEMVLKKNNDDDEGDESSSEEEDSSEEESEEEESEEDESESDSSEESEQEEVNKEVVEKTETMKTEEFETEDLHKELQQLKRQRPGDERHRHKLKTERHHYEEREHRGKGQGSSDARSDKERVREKGKGQGKYQGDTESRHSQSKSKGRSYEKGRSDQVAVDLKHRSYPKDSTKLKSERPDAREKQSKMDVERRKKDRSRKDSEKRVRSSTEDSSNRETKGKDRKNYSGSKRSSSASEKSNKESKDVEEDVPQNEPKKEEGKSLILTDRERRQFTNEVVDIESEGSSVEDEKQGVPSDVEMKLSDGEQEDDEEEEKTKLPPYYPAVRGCRNVEEFQWLNRIEEGTYGVVYRAKDKRTGDIVALKKLKMEREKEGFPITSLREINTLLKAQHPNIVTVREIVVGSNMDKIYIVMDYVEHDLKVLMEHMTQGFRIGEIKTLMIQLLRAVAHLHDNWILHRDLKASNLLLSNKGILKVGDFGLAREYGSPLKNYTPVVVTLWYRAPELLLGTKEYSTPIDLWSVGCIFAELLTMKPLFPGKSEIDQINRIFKELGTPSDKIWPGPPSYSELPAVQKMTFTDYPYNNLRNRFGAYLTDKGFDLLNRFLTYDPDKDKRITAENALKHAYFSESPQPVDPSMFPTWPAKSEMAKRPKRKDVEHSPKAPEGGAMFAKLADEGDSGSGSLGFRMPTSQKGSAAVAGFTLKF